MKAIVAAALAACMLASPAAAREPLRIDSARVEQAVRGFVEDKRLAGASVLIWQDGREVLFAAEGLADREEGRPFARDTLVQIYSMTKPVTGVALMQLWEQGKFGLDDPLEWHLPEYAALQVHDEAEPDKLRPPKRPVTIRDVMRHTAGFTYGNAGHPSDPVWAKLDPLSSSHTLAEFSALMAQVPLLYDPGTHWHYSAGVDVQARLVEVLSGQPFEAYVRNHVFVPLGMADSGWTRNISELPRLAAIYANGEGGAFERMPEDERRRMSFAGNPLTMGGAGITTTIDDYMRFARMLLGEGELDGTRVLQPSTVRLMATDHLDPRITRENRSWLVGKGSGGFGIDFFVRTQPPQTLDENRGAVGEFFWDGYASTLFWIDPMNDTAVVFFTQRTPTDTAIQHDIRDAIYGDDYTGP